MWYKDKNKIKTTTTTIKVATIVTLLHYIWLSFTYIHTCRRGDSLTARHCLSCLSGTQSSALLAKTNKNCHKIRSTIKYNWLWQSCLECRRLVSTPLVSPTKCQEKDKNNRQRSFQILVSDKINSSKYDTQRFRSCIYKNSNRGNSYYDNSVQDILRHLWQWIR